MRGRGRNCEREPPAAPAGKTTAHGVDRSDVEARSEEDLVELRQLRFGNSSQRTGDETGGAAADEHQREVAALHARGDLADALCGGERARSRKRMISDHDRDRAVWRAALVRRDDQAPGDLVE